MENENYKVLYVASAFNEESNLWTLYQRCLSAFEKVQSKIQTKREELDLRERLSALTNDMRKEQSDTAAAAKMAVEAFKNLGQETGGTE